jgi:polar amino acid transport system substrate-binding protein
VNNKKIFILFLILFWGVDAFGQEKIVTLATLTDFGPYCFKKENSIEIAEETLPPGVDSAQLQGYSWDVVRRSFHEVGYTIKLFIVPWERAMHYLKIAKVDAIFPANRTESREKLFHFSHEYVDRTRMVVYVPAGSTIEWHDLESLKDLSVGVVRGWAYGKKWDENTSIRKEPMDTILQSFQVMDRGRLAAVVGYEVAYDYALRIAGISQKFKKIGDFGVVDEYLMARINDPVAGKKLTDFDQGHVLLQNNGGMEEILKKWQ